MGKCRISSSVFALILTGLLFPVCASAQWDVEYDASSLIYPENNGTGWIFNNNDDGNHFQRGFVGNELWEDTMPPGDPSESMNWENTTGHFNFATGFIMEASIKMVTATDIYPRWGGAEIAARSDAGYNMTVDVDPNEVILGSIFNYVSYPMDTTDGFHTYRAVAFNNYGTLYVDDVPRLVLPLSSDNPIRGMFFGDQGWEGGEMYFDFVRYGVPEPATTTPAACIVSISLLRRRRGKISP